MNNPERQIGHITNTNKTKHTRHKAKKMDKHNPNKNWGSIQVLTKDKQFLFLKRYPTYYTVMFGKHHMSERRKKTYMHKGKDPLSFEMDIFNQGAT